MAHYAGKMVRAECVFLLSTYNADKGEITQEEIDKRVRQFDNLGRSYILTSKSTFVAMATYLRNKKRVHWLEPIYFVVGIDTILRVGDVKYVFNSQYELATVIERFHSLNVRFLICDRGGLTFGELPGRIPSRLLERCQPCEGYYDGGESSTAIRESASNRL